MKGGARAVFLPLFFEVWDGFHEIARIGQIVGHLQRLEFGSGASMSGGVGLAQSCSLAELAGEAGIWERQRGTLEPNLGTAAKSGIPSTLPGHSK
jgi:hypothetical protein